MLLILEIYLILKVLECSSLRSYWMHKYYFYKSGDDVEDSSIIGLIKKISLKHNLSYEVIDTKTLETDLKEELAESLRIISRREGIKVVSSGRGPLPISRSGKLNEIPILVVREGGKDIGVFPHVKNGKRIDILHHLNNMIDANSNSEFFTDESITESDISRMITSYPNLIDTNLEFIDTEIEVEGGRIDAVFKNRDEEHLLVEIEIKANDNAIAQVQRFKLPYAKKYGIPVDKIRLCIVCAEIGKSRIVACNGANIEVYQLNLIKLN